MSFMHLVFCCLAIHSVSEGRIIQGIIGQNVSFSWTYNVTFYDAILILHNESIFCVILPSSNNSGPLKETDRFRVFADNITPDKVKLTVHFLNFSTIDIGLYRVVRQRNSRELDASVHLETNGSNHYTKTVTTRKKDTEGIHHYTSVGIMQEEETSEDIKYYMTAATSRNDDAEGINRYSTAAMTPDADVEAFPSKRHLLYIVLGMGAFIAVALFACLLHKIRICVRMNRVSSCNTLNDSSKEDVDENLQEVNLPANYWTIVSNERGEMSTAIETDLERHREPSLIVQATISTNNESEHLLRRYTIRINDELDEYLNPVHSSPVKFDEYIDPVHSDSVEFDEYIHPIHSDPVEFDSYIHPFHTDSDNTG